MPDGRSSGCWSWRGRTVRLSSGNGTGGKKRRQSAIGSCEKFVRFAIVTADAESQTLPPTLTHPTISLMTLVIRDPSNFHCKPYSVPRAADLRLFTAGSDSPDLTERCLHTGRVLVLSFVAWFLTR